MKKKSFLMTAVSTIGLTAATIAQNVVTKKTYYDVYHTKLKAEWQQTANGYTNGYYKEYYPSGKLYIDRLVKTQNEYPYWGIDLKWKVYTEAGELKWSITQNDKREFQGEQISYMYSGPNLVKRSRAVFTSGKLITFELFRKNGKKSLELNTNSFYRTYDENGEILDNVKINPSGKFSGILYQEDNEIVVEVLDGKIQKVYEKNPNPKNGNWNAYRLENDTLVSTAREGETYFKKYFIDTVNVGLIAKPTIVAGITEYQNNEFGLDFVDPIFLCCKLSDRYLYNLRFYDRSFQTFVKQEIRDIKTDRLISVYADGKDIYYHDNGTIKKIFQDEKNWEEFDENGNLVNSPQIMQQKEQERLKIEKEKQLQIEQERLKKIENDRRISEYSQKLLSKYNEFKMEYVEKKVSLIKDINGNPVYKDSYLHGEQLYLKVEKVYADFLSRFQSEIDADKKMLLGDNYLKFHEKMMIIAKSDSKKLKDLNKAIEKAITIDEIMLILDF